MENSIQPHEEILTPDALAEHKALEAQVAAQQGGTAYEEGIVIPMQEPTLEELHEMILDPMISDEERLKLQEQVNRIEERLGMEEGKTSDSVAA